MVRPVLTLAKSATSKKGKGVTRQPQCRNRGSEGRMKDMKETMMKRLSEMKEADTALLVEQEDEVRRFTTERGKRV